MQNKFSCLDRAILHYFRDNKDKTDSLGLKCGPPLTKEPSSHLYPAAQPQCASWDPLTCGGEASHPSPCGPIPYSTDDSQFTYDCNVQNSCSLTCENGQVANTKVWICDTDTNTWENPFNHDLDTRPLECIDDIDTPCGNVADLLTLDGPMDPISCDQWVSIYNTAAIYECRFSCLWEGYTLHQGFGSNDQLICFGVDNQWYRKGSPLNSISLKNSTYIYLSITIMRSFSTQSAFSGQSQKINILIYT